MDRIDIHIEVPRVDYEKLSGDRVGEPSECIRARVQAARNIQLRRFSQNGSTNIICNADMHIGEIRQFYMLPDEGQSLMRRRLNSIYRRVRIIVSSNWHARSPIWQGSRRSSRSPEFV